MIDYIWKSKRASLSKTCADNLKTKTRHSRSAWHSDWILFVYPGLHFVAYIRRMVRGVRVTGRGADRSNSASRISFWRITTTIFMPSCIHTVGSPCSIEISNTAPKWSWTVCLNPGSRDLLARFWILESESRTMDVAPHIQDHFQEPSSRVRLLDKDAQYYCNSCRNSHLI